MWNELIERLYDDAELAAPASNEDIDRIERQLGQTVHSDLRDLLREADGVEADEGAGLVWSTRDIVGGDDWYKTYE